MARAGVSKHLCKHSSQCSFLNKEEVEPIWETAAWGEISQVNLTAEDSKIEKEKVIKKCLKSAISSARDEELDYRKRRDLSFVKAVENNKTRVHYNPEIDEVENAKVIQDANSTMFNTANTSPVSSTIILPESFSLTNSFPETPNVAKSTPRLQRVESIIKKITETKQKDSSMKITDKYDDALDLFFLSIAASVKQLPKEKQIRAKLQVLTYVCELELEETKRKK